MASTYSLETRSGRKQFHNACIEAALHCPQFNYKVVEDLRYLDDTESIIRYWSDNRTLFSAGYKMYLSEKAVSTFKKNPISVLF